MASLYAAADTSIPCSASSSVGDLDYDIVGNVYVEVRPRFIGMHLGPRRYTSAVGSRPSHRTS